MHEDSKLVPSMRQFPVSMTHIVIDNRQCGGLERRTAEALKSVLRRDCDDHCGVWASGAAIAEYRPIRTCRERIPESHRQSRDSPAS